MFLQPIQPMADPELGLVCITSSEAVRYRALTRARLAALRGAARREKLREVYEANLERLNAALSFCAAREIRLYRVTSGLFPFSEEVLGQEVLEDLRLLIGRVGARARRLGIRLVLHPDPFVVLNSIRSSVVENSIRALESHARVFDLLGMPKSPWAAIEIHGGKGGRGAELVAILRELPRSVRSRLVLENDERSYGAEEILGICREAGVPMVFDAHHHVVNEELDSYDHPSVEHYLQEASTTWPDPSWQIVHISNGREFFRDSRHHDLISILPRCYALAPWIEVEAKLKEAAIQKIRLEWLRSVA